MRRLLIDGPWMAQREFQKLGHLSVKIGDKDVSTGISYAFIKNIAAIVRVFDIERVSIFWDLEFSWNVSWPSFAKDMFSGMERPSEKELVSLTNTPTYKRTSSLETYRKTISELGHVYWESLNVLRNEFIPSLGVPQYACPGWEAGDLLFSERFDHPGDSIFILSDSPRFYYLLGPDNYLIQSSDTNKMYTMEKLNNDLGVNGCLTPSQVLDVIAFGGVVQDNIPCVNTLTYAQCAQLLLYKGGSINTAALTNGIADTALRQKFIDNRSIVPHYHCRALYGYADVNTKYDDSKIDGLLGKYQFKSLISKPEWKEYFKKAHDNYLLEAAKFASSQIKSKLSI